MRGWGIPYLDHSDRIRKAKPGSAIQSRSAKNQNSFLADRPMVDTAKSQSKESIQSSASLSLPWRISSFGVIKSKSNPGKYLMDPMIN